jgi:hypothetical protein
MNRSKALLFLPLLLLTAFTLPSCSGPKGTVICTVNCGGGGNGSVIVTVTSTPSQTFSFPYLEWGILSVQLINSSGGATTVVAGALPPAEFARLQTDSQFLGKALSPVPAGTYTSAKIQLAPSTAASYFYNGSNATLLGCAPGAVCKIPGTVAGFGATTVTVPVSFTVTANNNVGFSLNFDLSKAVTTAGGMTFDFTQSGAITLSALPRKGQSSGLDSLENFTGNVTAVTGTTSISMASLSSDTRTFTMAATVEFDDPFSICTAPASFSCLAVNQNISVDAVINSDGTLTAYEVEFLDKFAQEAEGILVTPITNNQFKMVVTNGVGNSSFLPGTLATVNVNNASTYFVDPKNLGVSATPPLGFTSSSDLVMGQTIMLQGGTIDFTTNTLSNYTRTLLRYSSIGGTVQSPSGTVFTLSGVSPLLTNLVTNSVQVQTFANTTYDNLTGGFSGLVTGTNASVRGLYLNPNSGATQPLLAAQVRAH